MTSWFFFLSNYFLDLADRGSTRTSLSFHSRCPAPCFSGILSPSWLNTLDEAGMCPSTLLPARDSLLIIQLCSLPQRSPSTAMGNDTNLLSSDLCWKQSYPSSPVCFPYGSFNETPSWVFLILSVHQNVNHNLQK